MYAEYICIHFIMIQIYAEYICIHFIIYLSVNENEADSFKQFTLMIDNKGAYLNIIKLYEGLMTIIKAFIAIANTTIFCN